MPYNSFLDGFSLAFLIGGAISAFTYAAFWLDDKICDQDEQIEELFSLLEENHELKK